LGGLNFYNGVPSLKPSLGDPVRSLKRNLFGRARILLYVSEALCVAAVLGCLKWD